MILTGDCRDVLPTLEAESVQCVVTSPPYFGLRDYGVDGQIGLEPTPDEYVAEMVRVFREVRRVLREDGVLWLNLGDSYCNVDKWGGGGANTGKHTRAPDGEVESWKAVRRKWGKIPGLKPKDLIGIPWAVATALRDPYYAGRIKRVEDRAWLAAIIDGEGTITATAHERKDDGRTRTIANLFVTNSCSAMLDRCAEIWPGGSRHEHMKPSEGHIGTRDVYRWIPTSAVEKALLLRELYPHFVSKKKQALLAWNLLEYMKEGQKLGKSSIAASVREKRERLVELIQALNQGGSVDVPDWCKEPPSLHEQGYYLRSDIIWSKPNPMPESVRDRPTKAHEYLFLLTKSERYFYDADAIAEPAAYAHEVAWDSGEDGTGGNASLNPKGASTRRFGADPTTRNARTVWTIPTQPFPDAHFAVFPPEIARRCILAGSRPGDTVLDPFSGAGTTGYVAQEHGRGFVGIELNPEYVRIAEKRTAQQTIWTEPAT